MKQKLKNSNSELVTKDFLKKELEVLGRSLRSGMKISISESEQRTDENAQKYRDQILTSNDKLAKTLETMREELEIGNFQMKRRIDKHEERIKNLEKVPQTA
ncbi:MAG: hypothetical protein A3B47_03975 [Candidatus Levybacteria bacterium RIFCSPLOWO2_01_FULL_39_24]|nr:MAG: hypothetical protein A2800_00160 [Candidatus Levybacteria bacterium RIFCSPHIGHO2_01_FULL_40_16]OGH27793.1 MAG: hypothetical protein A3E12_00860 [Candidatus Levybacteria bacterium RIFCSPHIGHO2_12_FULL_39_9]OGH45831.1 MAG: hypothetical protein A3B47_03975 [Candidatus Levybacteria bacterium RIFCSPLOWO2_01_FULL_39_24]